MGPRRSKTSFRSALGSPANVWLVQPLQHAARNVPSPSGNTKRKDGRTAGLRHMGEYNEGHIADLVLLGCTVELY